MAPNNRILDQALFEIALATLLASVVVGYFLPDYDVFSNVLMGFVVVILVDHIFRRLGINLRRVFDFTIWKLV